LKCLLSASVRGSDQMVLADLGGKITGALRKLQSEAVIDDDLLDLVMKEIAAALLQADVPVRAVAELRKNVKTIVNMEDAPATNKRKLVQKAVVEELVRLLTPSRKPYQMKKGQCNVVMFVGLQGSGKTTTCTKFAHFYQRKGWKCALVCADTFRAGAYDQLRQNAAKAKIPFYGSYSETDPVKIAEEGVEMFRAEKYDIIIVDTSGRHKQETALFDEMQQVAEAVDPSDIIFVMDSHIGQACFDQAQAFTTSVDVGSVIVTKLDGHAKGGGALSAVAATGSPIIFIGTGEHFDDFESFEAQSFVSRLLGLGDLAGLFSTIKDAVPLDKQPELLNRISKGIFTMRDLYEQFENVQKMGPMSQVLSMIPGMNSNMLSKGAEKEGVKRIKMFMVTMDSMNDDELDCVKPMIPSRVNRVARGAGVGHKAVETLMEEYKRMSKMVGKFGKMGMAGKGGDMSAMMRNPKQMMQKMSSMMDPKMLKQMGGAGNMMNMMKQMGKMDGKGGGGGLPGLGGMDMGDMMKQMQKMGLKM